MHTWHSTRRNESKLHQANPIVTFFRYLPSAWRLRKPDHRPCTPDHWCPKGQAGRWSNQHWGQTWRVRHQPWSLAAVLWRHLNPWLHSSTRSMKPTETRPLPGGDSWLLVMQKDWRMKASIYKHTEHRNNRSAYATILRTWYNSVFCVRLKGIISRPVKTHLQTGQSALFQMVERSVMIFKKTYSWFDTFL